MWHIVAFGVTNFIHKIFSYDYVPVSWEQSFAKLTYILVELRITKELEG